MSRGCLLSQARAGDIRRDFGTPTFVYDQGELERRARAVLAFPNPYGLTARYAMKACPNAALYDASSTGSVCTSMPAVGLKFTGLWPRAFPAIQIQLTAQQLPDDLEELLKKGVLFNACSLNQLREFGRRSEGGQLVCTDKPRPGIGAQQSH